MEENNGRLVNIAKKKKKEKSGGVQNGEQRPNKDFHPALAEIKKTKPAVRNMFHFVLRPSSYKRIILRRRNCSREQT